jgi:Alkylmercury lyase
MTVALASRVHHALLAAIVRDGHAPGPAALAATLGVPVSEIDAALRRLADEHGVVLHPHGAGVWVVHPFALSPSSTWVETPRGGWWAPCLWCGFGILAALGDDGRDAHIHARLGGEARATAIVMEGGDLLDEGLVVHFALPPRVAWDNVVHWCASVQPFTEAGEVPAWCERHGYEAGAIVPLAQVRALARAWYGRHLDPAWRKHTAAEAQAIFTQVGLTGAFWSLPPSSERF